MEAAELSRLHQKVVIANVFSKVGGHVQVNRYLVKNLGWIPCARSLPHLMLVVLQAAVIVEDIFEREEQTKVIHQYFNHL